MFTQSELVGKTIYSATPSALFLNTKASYASTSFKADGTLTRVSGLPASPLTESGTFSIDNTTGVLTITFDSPTPLKVVKTALAADSYNSFPVKINNTVIEQWFFDQTIGASQALASAQGATIPVTQKILFTQSELLGKTIYSAVPSNIFLVANASYAATTFKADGTLTRVSGLPSSARTDRGTYSIDLTTGVLTITFGSDPPIIVVKTANSDPVLNSNLVTTTVNASTQAEQWFFDQVIGASQALACAQGATIPSTIPVSASAFPFDTGTIWTYKNATSTIVDSVTSSSTPFQVTRTTTNAAGSITEFIYYIDLNGRLYYSNANSVTGSLALPDFQTTAQSASAYTVLGQESITVTAGIFTAWKYTQTDSGGNVKTKWYVPGFGLVRTAESDGSMTDLQTYTIKIRPK